MDHWGRRLQQAFRRRRIRKLHALAAEIGVDQSAISRWRKGQPISLANAVVLCHALDISLDWLVTGHGTMEAHRGVASTPAELIAEVLFGNITASEAAAFRQTLNTLSEAAARRASCPDA